MKFPLKERAFSAVVVVPSAVIVIVLAVLQYWWSTKLSEATAVRLADSLQMSMTNWQGDLFRYLLEIGLAMRTDPSDSASAGPDQYVRRLAEWRAVAKYPDLVSSVYLLNTEALPALLLKPGASHFESAVWAPELEGLRRNLGAAAAELLQVPAVHNGASDLKFDAALFGMRGPSAGWRFDPDIPALLHPVLSDPVPGNGAHIRRMDWILIELNPEAIRGVLGDLAQIYFQGIDGLDYQVATVAPGKPRRTIYSSDPGFGSTVASDADGVLNVFARSEDGVRDAPVRVFHLPSSNKEMSAVRLSFFSLIPDAPQSHDWQLIVRHRRGGALGTFVADMHRRDLAISSGLLLLVMANMAMLVATSHRARRLAQLQMNFVTAVSHELRTPLTVIISGADNICNGVVETKQQVQQYGSVIGNQARQLFGLVERILLFASTRQARQSYQLQPLEIRPVIDAALASAAGLIEAGQVDVECEIESDLPPVNGDATALSQCLQNLIANAVKYGKEKHWLGIRAAACDNGIRIDVSDRGIGIGAPDLPHVFEPFYRSPSVRAAQIHGTGLGLALSKSIAEAMNGKLTVTSTLGRGSTFSLHLPRAEKPFPA